MPLVSVIIPTHNRRDLVGEAVASALAQRDVAAEVIVVDDGSTDDTAAALAVFSNRIRYQRQPRCGVSAVTWRSKHSLYSRAPTPGGSSVCTRARASSSWAAVML